MQTDSKTLLVMLLETENPAKETVVKRVREWGAHVAHIVMTEGCEMEAIAVVTILALIQYFVFGYQVGQMRVKHGVRAPAIVGAPEFERMFRVQQNTLEQIVIFIPALWIYGEYVHPLWGAAIGLVFIVGRFLYKSGYVADPSKRSPGFIVCTVSVSILLLAGLWGAGSELYSQYMN